jgi:hypothetical protein
MLPARDPVRRIAFTLAWLLAAALLLRFGYDFTAAFWPAGGAPRLLVPAFWALVGATLAVSAANILRARRGVEAETGTSPAGTALRAAVPVAFLASSLGCSGLSPGGCSTACTLIRWVGIPLIAAAVLVPFSGRYLPAPLVLALAAISLVPHCICINPGNAWWVAKLGASPMCHAWSFSAALVALSAVSSPGRPLASLLVTGAIVGGSLAFFASHHFAGYPW